MTDEINAVPTMYDIYTGHLRPVTQADVNAWLRWIGIIGPLVSDLAKGLTEATAGARATHGAAR